VNRFALGQLFEFSNGVNAGKDAYGSGVPFANVLEVITNEGLRVSDVPGRIALPRELVQRYSVRKGDVLFNRSSETQEEVGLSSTYLDDVPIVFGGFVLRGRPKSNALQIEYSQYALRAPDIRAQIVARGQGGIRANIGQRDLATVMIDLPDAETQRTIAHRLDDSRELIRVLERLIVKKRLLKVGMMQQLLTGETRLNGFDQPWALRKLKDLGIFLKGRGIKRDEVQRSGVPCIRYGELYTEYSNYTASTRSFADAAVAANALAIRKGDILFAASGETKEEIGMSVAYVGDTGAVAGGDIVVLRGPSFDPIFLSSLLNTSAVAAQKARVGQGDAVVHIHARSLAEITVSLPDVDEQRAIAEVIVDVDAEIDALERQLTSARAIKQGMMHELLSGRTRLIEGAAA
jgi:type I restriction enzyme S subunit